MNACDAEQYVKIRTSYNERECQYFDFWVNYFYHSHKFFPAISNEGVKAVKRAAADPTINLRNFQMATIGHEKHPFFKDRICIETLVDRFTELQALGSKEEIPVSVAEITEYESICEYENTILCIKNWAFIYSIEHNCYKNRKIPKSEISEKLGKKSLYQWHGKIPAIEGKRIVEEIWNIPLEKQIVIPPKPKHSDKIEDYL